MPEPSTETPEAADAEPARRRGRTPPLDPAEADQHFHTGVALFNGTRYWHAHEAWETVWRAASDEERDFFQGLIQIAAGLLHLKRRNRRGALNKLSEGIARLRPYAPTHHGIFVNELIGQVHPLLAALERGEVPYLISPVIRFADAAVEPDWSR